MDSNEKNRAKNNNQEEWNDPSFSWEEMQEGIFDKILEEEPDFFEEKPRRRIAIWFWFGAAALIFGGLGAWYFMNDKDETIIQPSNNTPTEIIETKTSPVAESNIKEEKTNTVKPNNLIQTNKLSTSTISLSKKSTVQKDASTEKTLFNTKNETLISSNQITEPEKEENNLSPQLIIDNKIQTPASLSVNIPFVKLEKEPLILSTTYPKQENTEENIDGLKDDEEESQKDKNKKEKGQWAVVATGGTVLSFSKYSGNSNAENLRNDNTSPFFGYQFGVEAFAPLSSKSRITFGVNRAVVYQNIDIQTFRQVQELQENALLHVTHYAVGNRVAEVHGDTLVTGIERNRLVKYNEFKSIRAHAGYMRDFKKENWSFSPFAGMSFGFIDHQDGYTVAQDNSIFAFNNDNPIFNRLQVNSMAGIAVERKIGKSISLLFQYRIDQQWNNASAEDELNLRPANHYLSAGISKKW